MTEHWTLKDRKWQYRKLRPMTKFTFFANMEPLPELTMCYHLRNGYVLCWCSRVCSLSCNLWGDCKLGFALVMSTVEGEGEKNRDGERIHWVSRGKLAWPMKKFWSWVRGHLIKGGLSLRVVRQILKRRAGERLWAGSASDSYGYSLPP